MMLVDLFYLYRGRSIAAGVGLVAAVVLGLVFAPGLLRKQQAPLQCILLDTSGSTKTALPDYDQLSRSIVATQSNLNSSVCFVAVEGDPAADGDVRTEYVGSSSSNSSDARLERLQRQAQADSDINTLLADPQQTIPGSALVEALDIIARFVRPGDTIHVFSDGLQDSKTFKLRSLLDSQFSPTAIASELDLLDRQGLIPALAGVKVTFETPGYRPNVKQSVVPDQDAERFWAAWGLKANASLSWGPAA